MKAIKAIKAPNRYLKAFTLVESVAVFLVVAAFCLLPVLGVKSWQEELEIKRFLNRFEKMVLVCQQISIVEEQVTSIKNIRIPERVFVFSTGSTSAERPRPFDDDIFETLFIPEALKGGNSISEIKFLAREGHPSKLVKVKFIWEKRNITYRYQFQLGGGRFEKSVE